MLVELGQQCLVIGIHDTTAALKAGEVFMGGRIQIGRAHHKSPRIELRNPNLDLHLTDQNWVRPTNSSGMQVTNGGQCGSDRSMPRIGVSNTTCER